MGDRVTRERLATRVVCPEAEQRVGTTDHGPVGNRARHSRPESTLQLSSARASAEMTPGTASSRSTLNQWSRDEARDSQRIPRTEYFSVTWYRKRRAYVADVPMRPRSRSWDLTNALAELGDEYRPALERSIEAQATIFGLSREALSVEVRPDPYADMVVNLLRSWPRQRGSLL